MNKHHYFYVSFDSTNLRRGFSVVKPTVGLYTVVLFIVAKHVLILSHISIIFIATSIIPIIFDTMCLCLFY